MSDPETDPQKGSSRLKTIFKWIGITVFYIVVFGASFWLLGWSFNKGIHDVENFHPHPLPTDHGLDGLFWGLAGAYGVVLGIVVTFVLVVIEKNRTARLVVLAWAIVAIGVPLRLLVGHALGVDGQSCGSYINPKNNAPQCFSILSLQAKWAFGIAGVGLFLPIVWLVADAMRGQGSSEESADRALSNSRVDDADQGDEAEHSALQ
jgi:hypothetical protein